MGRKMQSLDTQLAVVVVAAVAVAAAAAAVVVVVVIAVAVLSSLLPVQRVLFEEPRHLCDSQR